MSIILKIGNQKAFPNKLQKHIKLEYKTDIKQDPSPRVDTDRYYCRACKYWLKSYRYRKKHDKTETHITNSKHKFYCEPCDTHYNYRSKEYHLKTKKHIKNVQCKKEFVKQLIDNKNIMVNIVNHNYS